MSDNHIHQAATRIAAGAREAEVLSASSAMPASFRALRQDAAPGAGRLIGSARYTLHNVAPRRNGVDIRVNIAWSTAVPLYADYLIINP